MADIGSHVDGMAPLRLGSTPQSRLLMTGLVRRPGHHDLFTATLATFATWTRRARTMLMTPANTTRIPAVAPKMVEAQGRGAGNAACVNGLEACWMTATVSWHAARWRNVFSATIVAAISCATSSPLWSLLSSPGKRDRRRVVRNSRTPCHEGAKFHIV